MVFRSHSNGSHHPLTPVKSTNEQTYVTLKSQNKARTRLITREEKAKLSTLENPLLYSNFLKKIQKLNPDFDVQLIDRTLEPEEALMDLKRKDSTLDIGLREKEGGEFREFLNEFGIENEKIQNMVVMQEPPLNESELANLSYVLNNRPPENVLIDESLKAPITTDLRKWSDKPNRYDLKGFRF